MQLYTMSLFVVLNAAQESCYFLLGGADAGRLIKGNPFGRVRNQLEYSNEAKLRLSLFVLLVFCGRSGFAQLSAEIFFDSVRMDC